MPDYAVTIAIALDPPATEGQLDVFLDALPDAAAASCSQGAVSELSVTTDVVAAEPVAALSVIEHVMRSLAADSGMTVDRVVEAEVLEWARHAARNLLPSELD